MTRYLWLIILLLPLMAWSQSGTSGGVRVTGTPAANDCVKFVSKTVITTAGAPCGSGSGAGTVTSVLGTTNQINSDGSTTTPTLSLSSTIIAPGTVTVSIAGAASTPGLTVSGAPFTGGSGTTTFPQVYINSGAAPTTFSTSGTALGINAPSGFAGNFFDLHLNGGVSLFSVSSAGAITAASSIQSGSNVSAAAGGQLSFVGRGKFLSPADGVLTASNNASNGFTRLNFGVATSSGPAFGVSGTTVTMQLGDGTAGGQFNTPVLGLVGATSGVSTFTPSAIAGTSTNPITSTNVLTLPTGNATSPAINFAGNLNTGFAQIDGSGSVSFVNNGSRKHTFDTTRYALVDDAGNVQLGGSSDVNWSRGGAGISDFGNGTAANTTGKLKASAYMSLGTKFTLSSNGCSATTTLGGGSAGSFVSGTTGTCAVTILMGDSATAPTGWHCTFENHTTSANFLSQTGAADTTHCSMTGTTVSGDLISFSARGY